MGKVITNLTMSLDGFIAGPRDDVQQLFQWYSSGTTAIEVQGGVQAGRIGFKVSPQSAELISHAFQTTGTMVTGRRNFDVSGAWDGHPPYAPCFVVTHRVPQEWAFSGSPFTFVTDGVQGAIQQAKAVAGDGDVLVATASITQQCLQAGLLDEIYIDLVPILLGAGIRLFDHLPASPIELESTRVIKALGVTHLVFRIKKEQTIPA